MKGFLFFSRVALIFNVLFFIAVGLQYVRVEVPQSAASILVIGGLFLGLIVNLLVNVWFAVMLVSKKLQLKINSLFFINLVILIIQLLIYFI